MKVSILRKNFFIVFGLPILMVLSLIILSKSTVFLENQSTLSVAITLDLIITIPFLYYLLIRKTTISKTSISLFVTIGFLVAQYIVPLKNQYLLSQIKLFVLPLFEIVLMFYIFKKVQEAIQLYKKESVSLDFYEVVQKVTQEIFPKKIALIFTSEIGMLYYAFFAWKKKEVLPNEFTYHKKSVGTSYLIGFIMMVLFETVGVHFLIARYSFFWAWIVTVLTVYTALQLVALIRSFSKRPSIFLAKDEKLVLRYGYFSETTIFVQNIRSIALYKKDLPDDKSIVSLSFFGKIPDYNVCIQLYKKNTIDSIYGLKKEYTSLAFFVDDAHRFKELLSSVIVNQT